MKIITYCLLTFQMGSTEPDLSRLNLLGVSKVYFVFCLFLRQKVGGKKWNVASLNTYVYSSLLSLQWNHDVNAHMFHRGRTYITSCVYMLTACSTAHTYIYVYNTVCVAHTCIHTYVCTFMCVCVLGLRFHSWKSGKTKTNNRNVEKEKKERL